MESSSSSSSKYVKRNSIILLMFFTILMFVSFFNNITRFFAKLTTFDVYTTLNTLTLDGNFSFHNNHHAATDFGNIHHFLPLAVLYPKSVSDISTTIKHVFEMGSDSLLRVAARGHGHSLQGQSQVADGIVINMESLKSYEVGVHVDATGRNGHFADVSGGDLWIHVLHETLKYGLSPKSCTDYLHLSVGGTLSNGGISGQAFKHGPQIDNVYELQVVTGKGEVVTCSKKHNSDLFYGVLGGLGQFGVITRARISLGPAPQMVKWIRVLYSEFSIFTKDQEHLISTNKSFDYIEGFVVINRTGLLNNWRSSFNPKDPILASQFNTDGKTLYCLEMALYFNPDDSDISNQITESLLSQLSYIPSTLFISQVGYVEFLDRVHKSEMKLEAKGLWQVPHPWLNLLIPKTNILTFGKEVFGNILRDNNNNGPILMYPVNKSKWDNRTSLQTPNEDVFYIVSLLSSALPSSNGQNRLEEIIAQNKRIIYLCATMNLGVKHYLPHYGSQEEWKGHFGNQWERFVRRKYAYDPLAILAPGQQIFQKPKSFGLLQNIMHGNVS